MSLSRSLKLTPELVARAHRVVPTLPLPDYLTPRTDADHEADVAAILANRPSGEDFWLFAYGSLLWNPAVDHVDEAPALVHGWHRAFCMTMRGHRGTPDRPGLMMALDRGGQCQGVVLKLPPDKLEDELFRLVRREMPVKRVDGIPVQGARWIRAKVGSRTISSLAYVINHRGPSYAGRMNTTEIADVLASSCGPGGSCAEYLYQTVVQLDKRGIRDNKLWKLQALVAERLE
jgi:glutathione-specific gamma-glutamylcyclotransferase